MRKRQILAAVIALAFAGFVFIGYRYQKNRRFVLTETNRIANHLVLKKSSPALYPTGIIFRKELFRVLASPTQVMSVKFGDEPSPIGDGSASSRIVLSNRNGKVIGIRLRRDVNSNKFYVAGFWNAGKTAPTP